MSVTQLAKMGWTVITKPKSFGYKSSQLSRPTNWMKCPRVKLIIWMN